jgi:hypothetical protein
MAQWQDIGLVLAGSVGPLAVAIANGSFNRRLEMSRWKHTERDAQRDMYAHFIASATQLVADWLDYETLPPKSEEDERKLDEVHDAHYHELVILTSMVRITANAAVVKGGEEILRVVRDAKKLARRSREPGTVITSPEWLEIEHEFAAARTQFVNALRVMHTNLDLDEDQPPKGRMRGIRGWDSGPKRAASGQRKVAPIPWKSQPARATSAPPSQPAEATNPEPSESSAVPTPAAGPGSAVGASLEDCEPEDPKIPSPFRRF